MTARPVLFGEILVDRFPDGQSVLGGAPFNVAWHLQAFGLAPLLISRVGEDESGQRILATMGAWGMSTAGIQIDREHPTGVVNVTLVGTEPRYDIVEHSAFDYIDKDGLPPLETSAFLYHGSLACRNSVSREALLYLKSQRPVPCFVDVNLRKPHYSLSEVRSLVQGASWLKLNEAEFREVFSADPDSLQSLVAPMQKLDLENLVVTRGERGAEVRTRQDSGFIVKPARPKAVIDTVGAGDAFSSVLLLGQVCGWGIEQSLNRAHEFAEAILGVRGATVNDPEFYRPFTNSWRLGQA